MTLMLHQRIHIRGDQHESGIISKGKWSRTRRQLFYTRTNKKNEVTVNGSFDRSIDGINANIANLKDKLKM